MKKRLLFGLGGAVVGVSVSAPLQDALHWSATLAIIVCLVLGGAIGLMATVVWDAFNAASDQM